MTTWTVRHVDRQRDILGTVEADTKDAAAELARLRWPGWAEKREHLFGFIIQSPRSSVTATAPNGEPYTASNYGTPLNKLTVNS
jgi:hypothetical protein